MPRIGIVISLLCLVITFGKGCSNTETTTYRTIVAAKAFLDSVKSKHPECSSPSNIPNDSELCQDLRSATAAKDTMIDALTVYCSGDVFNSGGQCQPPTKASPLYSQAKDKLATAILNYQQIETDLKGVL